MSNLKSSASPSKAGRHRIYTNEQRKDRNREAQAAFRDRRSNYTKVLENSILKFEGKIQDLKAAQNVAIKRAEIAEEQCLQLSSEVVSLRNLLQIALTENQCLLQNDKVILPTIMNGVNVLSIPDVLDIKWLEDINYDKDEFISNGISI